jgi:prepilin-type N-terminal cleavage/methylation domain-containing protein
VPARRARFAGGGAGFTLLEVLVAVVVLALGIMATSKLAFRSGRLRDGGDIAAGGWPSSKSCEYGPTTSKRTVR